MVFSLIISVLIFASLCLATITIYLFYFLIKDKDKNRDISVNEDFIIIFDSNLSDEGCFGLIEDIEYSDNRVKVVFSSRDKNILKEAQGIGQLNTFLSRKNLDVPIKSKVLFFDKNLLVESGLSTNKRVYFAFPQKYDRIPENTKNTVIGNMASELINNKKISMDEKELYKKRLKSIKEIAMKQYGEELSLSLIENANRLLKEKKDLLTFDNKRGFPPSNE
jgi:hypothetical protein